MTYDELVNRVAEATRLPPETVRAVLFALPDALIALRHGDMVRTPMGVFRMMTRRPRKVVPPIPHARPVEIPAEQVVKLKAGSRLRR